MKNSKTITPTATNPRRITPARLVFIAPLPDGKEAFAFVSENGNRPFIVIAQAGATQLKENQS